MKLKDDNFTLEMSIDENKRKLLVQEDINLDYAGNYLVTIREGLDEEFSVSCEKAVDI